ncbi:hypothetical protein MMC09_002992 [Bachmanniomyces sp. S44760]|nr:hypothetical protein [Bachmanniomyces sp. S44760]
MSVEQQLFVTLDDFNPFYNDLSLNIPPLQDPEPTKTAGRPSPLEPNARVHGGVDTVTSIAATAARRKALAAAKSIGEPDSPPKTRKGSVIPPGRHSKDLRADGLRKTHKIQHYERVTDFVQLPRPNSKIKDEKPPPFRPVSVLNELHEPPPSAALFPPITPNASQEQQQHYLPESSPCNQASEEQLTASESGGNGNTQEDDRAIKQHRNNLRPRQKWSELETKQLLEGIKIYGQGKWKKILEHPEFSFLPERTSVDLKDRYRTVVANDRVKPVLLAISSPQHPYPARSGDAQSIPIGIPPAAFNVSMPILEPCLTSPALEMIPTSKRSSSPANWKTRGKRTFRQAWTEEEDENLAKGYRQYGFQWTAIAKDPSCKLSHRRGNQIRDRFRLKYAAIYRQAVANGPNKKSGFEAEAMRKQSGNGHRADQVADDSAPRTIRLAALETLPRFPVSEGKGPNRHRSAHADESRSYKGGILNLLNTNEEDEEQAEDADEEDGDSGRLPPIRYPLDYLFCGPGAGSGMGDGEGDEGGIMLPPLLWEDMATRPMFDLE